MVTFDNGRDNSRTLDGEPVVTINPDLTSEANTTTAKPLPENANLCFMGTTIGAFDITPEVAAEMLSAPINPTAFSNSDVARPWLNATVITHRPRGNL